MVLDGATGTALAMRGLTAADYGGEHLLGCHEALVLSRPEVVTDLHRSYLDAGADIVETDTFGATPVVLAEYGLAERCREINRRAAELARRACAAATSRDVARPRFVAGSIGPTTKALTLTGGSALALTVSAKGVGFQFDLAQFNSATTRAGKKFAGIKDGDAILGVELMDLPNVLFLTSEGRAVVLAAKDIPTLTGAGKGVKLVNVKNGDIVLFRSVRKNEQVKVIDEKEKEKVIDLKGYGVMTRGAVGLKAVKAIRFA